MKGLVFDSSVVAHIARSRKISSLIVQCARGAMNVCVPALVLTEAAATAATKEATFHLYRLCQEIPAERMFVAPIGDNAIPFAAFRSEHALVLEGDAHAAYEAATMFWGIVSADQACIDRYRQIGLYVFDARDQ